MTIQGQDTLIVGAGLAGLALARELAQADRRVTVLDKARGVSGRSSTRRIGEARLDHGARFFTARGERTNAFVQEGLAAGWLAEWTRSVPKWEAGRVTQEGGNHPRYVAPAGMNTLGRELSKGVEIRTGAQVVRLTKTGTGWRVDCQDGRAFTASRLVLNLPAPQIVPLLAGTDIDGSPLQAVQIDPCWAVGAVLNHDIAGADWPALRVQEHPALEWIAREHTKRRLAPELIGHPPALMLHARADWTRAHLQDAQAEVEASLLTMAREIALGLDVAASFAHRWLYATPTERYPEAFGWLPEQQLGWCGDWCTPDEHGPRIEAALLSGWGLAKELVASGL
ncbi:NAD(P)/FAD-dependent oxidoreductase [Deinococcus sp.]|uniref:NAD(P)/FAD-dependent oxidoreductase n=1 Tax=Deinococcus sp. TaxID=47478 RepID=UPI003C7C884E